MKNLKKLLCAMMCAVLIVCAAGGCSVKDTNPSDVSSGAVSAEDGGNNREKPYKIGLLQYAEQPSLDTVREAFMSRLEEWGYNENMVEIDYQNAGGDADKAESICKKLVDDKADLIVAVSTPAAEIAVKAAKNTDTKVLFAAADMEADKKSVTGTRSSSSVAAVIDLALQTNPDMKTLGIMYDPDDAIAKVQADEAKKYCADKKLEVAESTLSIKNGTRIEDATKAATELFGKCDAVFTPIDSTASSFASAVATAAREAKKPWYAAELAMAERGALAAVSADYTELGCETADIAVELIAGRELSQLPTVEFNSFKTYINQSTLTAVQATITADTLSAAVFVTDSAAQ